MASDYRYIDDATLLTLLKTHRRNLAILMRQAGNYASGEAPLHVQNQLADEHAKIDTIETELRQRGITPPEPGSGA